MATEWSGRRPAAQAKQHRRDQEQRADQVPAPRVEAGQRQVDIGNVGSAGRLGAHLGQAVFERAQPLDGGLQRSQRHARRMAFIEAERCPRSTRPRAGRWRNALRHRIASAGVRPPAWNTRSPRSSCSCSFALPPPGASCRRRGRTAGTPSRLRTLAASASSPASRRASALALASGAVPGAHEQVLGILAGVRDPLRRGTGRRCVRPAADREARRATRRRRDRPLHRPLGHDRVEPLARARARRPSGSSG